MSEKKKVKIGRFEVLERLGEGVHGKLYLCWDPGLKRRVALKMIMQPPVDKENPQDVVSEALMAAKIKHPNVIPIYEVGIQNTVPVLVFEYVEGITLKQYLSNHGRLAQDKALSIFRNIADGLRCAHEQNIIHLDLSPNNIMIDRQGRPRIMDFGLARLTITAEKDRMAGYVSGTPRYMSPEHINGNKFTKASDIFSLGLMFYELLTGKQAIAEKEMIPIFAAVEMAKIDWGKIQYQGIAPELVAILRDMLHIDPKRRYQSAAELMTDLDCSISIANTADKNPLALDFLLRRLQRRPEFPACSQKISEINQITAPTSTASFKKVAEVIMQDYALTNRIMKISNSVAFNRGTDKVTTVSQAISKLGLKLVRMISNNLLIFRHINKKDDALKDVLVISFMSGLIARQISENSHARYAEEAFICALFHRLGYHLLAFYLTDEYNDILQLIAAGESPIKAERQILSTTCSAIGAAIAKKWNYSDNIINAMNILPEGVLAAPKKESDFLCHLASVANELCLLVEHQYNGQQQKTEIQQLLKRHHAFIKMDEATLYRIITQALSDFQQLAQDLGISYRRSQFCQHLRRFLDAEKAALEIDNPATRINSGG